MKRTFFAVKVSSETKKLMLEIVEKFPEVKKNVKIANPGNPHITLKFLGETKEADISKIDDKLQIELSNSRPFSFEVEKCGCFPNKNRPKVLWLGVNKGLIKLQSLHNLIDNILQPLGYENEMKDFVPHLTLGRVRNSVKKLDTIEEFLNYPFEPTNNSVDEVIWFESRLTPRGAIHKPLRIYKLK